MDKMSVAMSNYTGAFKLSVNTFSKNSGNKSGEYEIQIAQDKHFLQSKLLPCLATWLALNSSGQALYSPYNADEDWLFIVRDSRYDLPSNYIYFYKRWQNLVVRLILWQIRYVVDMDRPFFYPSGMAKGQGGECYGSTC